MDVPLDVQVLQFIRTFRAQVPLRNPERYNYVTSIDYRYLLILTACLFSDERLEGCITFHTWMVICFWVELLEVEACLCSPKHNLSCDEDLGLSFSQYVNQDICTSGPEFFLLLTNRPTYWGPERSEPVAGCGSSHFCSYKVVSGFWSHCLN